MQLSMTRGNTSSVVRFLRNHKGDKCASIIEVNKDIWTLVNLIRQLHFDRDLLLHQMREFSKLVFDKLALECSLGMIPASGNVDFQVLKVLLGRTMAVSRYLDPQTFDFSKSSPALLSLKTTKASNDTKCRKFHLQHIYMSQTRARKYLVELQTEHLRLNKNSYGVKQLLLRFDEDNALLRNDVKLLQQHPPALDSAQAIETWNKLARVELCFMSEAEKRRSIASQRRMSALSARRLSMTGSRASLRDPPSFPGSRMKYDEPAASASVATSDSPEGRAGCSEPSRYRLSKRFSGSALPTATDDAPLQANETSQEPDPQTLKRMSIVSLGKRSGAILSDWKWDGDDSDDEELKNQDVQLTDPSTSASRLDSGMPSSTATDTSSSTNTSVDSQPGYTKYTSDEVRSTIKPPRPRSFVVPRNRYSMYDRYGRKQG